MRWIVLSLLVATLAHAKPAAKKAPIARDELWASWPYQEEKYLAHEVCGEPTPFKNLEESGVVEGVSLCVNVTVRQASGCRRFPTTYRKLKGAAHYRFFSVGYDSRSVACP